MSGRYVCGAGLEEDWSDEGGEGDEEDERRGEAFVEGEEQRTEVAIMEIAKPMKLRGALCCCCIFKQLLTSRWRL